MTLTLYEVSMPHFVRMLCNLSAILDKAAAHAKANGIAEDELLDSRLAPDMYPLREQIRIAADMARSCAARLSGIPTPQYENKENKFADFQLRIEKTIDFLNGIQAEIVNAKLDELIVITMPDKKVRYTGRSFILDNILPHFYFHVTTAYTILRQQGVPLGKKDYIDNE